MYIKQSENINQSENIKQNQNYDEKKNLNEKNEFMTVINLNQDKNLLEFK